MSQECNHDCSNCESKCDNELPRYQMNEHSSVKKTYAIVSGKGGVGKSSLTALLASSLARQGYQVGVLDADITGPSIPKAFGIDEKATGSETEINPAITASGIKVMSINLLLENNSDPVVWRGPVITGIVQQFYENVAWGKLDYLLIDMPPGTGDVPLTVFQSIPIDGIVIVTSPQELVGMIVEKAVKMAKMMHIPVKGIVENYSFFTCPDNGKNYQIFGESHIDAIASEYDIDVLAKLPIDPQLAKLVDAGEVERYDVPALDDVLK